MEHHHVGSGAQAATLCNKRGAPVLKHRPLVLGLCLSLHWMQPSISLLFLNSFCQCLATELVLEASKHLQKLCLPASSMYLYFTFTFMFQSHRPASTGRAPGSCSTHVELILAVHLAVATVSSRPQIDSPLLALHPPSLRCDQHDL